MGSKLRGTLYNYVVIPEVFLIIFWLNTLENQFCLTVLDSVKLNFLIKGIFSEERVARQFN
jgi:hypothetical protein